MKVLGASLVLYNKKLVSLSLANAGLNCADPGTASSLAKMLQVNKSIDLSKNNTCLNSGGSCVFLKGLHYNTTLVNLNLMRNMFTSTY